ncbi:MAG: flavin reductase family protein [Deltaproteobacteria bacterium]|nr:flavin reductase family protein [Deltaproteobacteria bacterium]MBW2359887.1 flavin reductase family protein [Deltaproteobacteria bacterium]
MPISTDTFKKLCGRWTTGVTIVTTRHGDTVHGMTVSAFTEVSLDPPLVLVCADKGSTTHPVIEGGGVFAVNVLARGQEALSNKFASSKEQEKRFDGLTVDIGVTGAPILQGTVGAFDCRVEAAHEAGDHVVYVGRVEWLRVDESADPLLHQSGAYGGFAAS